MRSGKRSLTLRSRSHARSGPAFGFELGPIRDLHGCLLRRAPTPSQQVAQQRKLGLDVLVQGSRELLREVEPDQGIEESPGSAEPRLCGVCDRDAAVVIGELELQLRGESDQSLQVPDEPLAGDSSEG